MTAQQTTIPAILNGSVADGEQVIVNGVINNIDRMCDRNGEWWANVWLEYDGSGIKTYVFPKTYAVVRTNIAVTQAVTVAARVMHRDNGIALVISDVDLTSGIRARILVGGVI